MRPADFARLVALAAIWSLSFVFMRVVAPPLGPAWTAGLRVLIGGAALVAWLALSSRDASLREHWRAYLVIGAVNSALPFFLFAYAALSLPASYLVILNAMVPLFAVVLAALFLGEPLTLAKVAGIGIGIVGVALVTGAGAIAMDAAAWLAVTAALTACVCYAGTAVYIKLRGQALPPNAIAAWSQLFAALVLLPPALAFPPSGPVTPVVVANLLGLALLCSAVAYLLYFRLIRDIGPTRTATLTLIMPAFGIVWGAVLLGESITLTMLAGAALIVAGVAAVLRPSPVPGTPRARAASNG
jgi:drug/metabolite transporter (DMT)-like permease